MNNPKILCIAGSTRKDSVNCKLLRLAVACAKKSRISPTVVDLKNYDMPMYNGDLEAQSGIPKNALKLKKLFLEHDGLFFACPEYNSTIPPVLKNALDWVSRTETPEEKMLSAFVKKNAALCSASPSKLGGARGIYALRTMLENIFVTVVPEQVAIPDAYDAFDDDGNLLSSESTKELQALVDSLIAACAK